MVRMVNRRAHASSIDTAEVERFSRLAPDWWDPRGPMAALHIGCSGWSYKDWRGPFYPDKLAQKDWFSFYATQFDTTDARKETSDPQRLVVAAPLGMASLGRHGFPCTRTVHLTSDSHVAQK